LVICELKRETRPNGLYRQVVHVFVLLRSCGSRDSSVGTVTDYGLDGRCSITDDA
jgi:hypothetical protein